MIMQTTIYEKIRVHKINIVYTQFSSLYYITQSEEVFYTINIHQCTITANLQIQN